MGSVSVEHAEARQEVALTSHCCCSHDVHHCVLEIDILKVITKYMSTIEKVTDSGDILAVNVRNENLLFVNSSEIQLERIWKVIGEVDEAFARILSRDDEEQPRRKVIAVEKLVS